MNSWVVSGTGIRAAEMTKEVVVPICEAGQCNCDQIFSKSENDMKLMSGSFPKSQRKEVPYARPGSFARCVIVTLQFTYVYQCPIHQVKLVWQLAHLYAPEFDLYGWSNSKTNFEAVTEKEKREFLKFMMAMKILEAEQARLEMEEKNHELLQTLVNEKRSVCILGDSAMNEKLITMMNLLKGMNKTDDEIITNLTQIFGLSEEQQEKLVSVLKSVNRPPAYE
jgi:hypothetical protein